MLPDGLQGLLILQERDTRKAQLQKILAQVPRDRAGVEARIAAHRSAIEAARKGVTDLELRRKELESELRALEEQARKYRGQQALVKKNDEYQALSHEIEATAGKIGALEETEIQLLYDLDSERAKAREAEARINAEIAAEQAQLGRIAERQAQVEGDVATAEAEVAKAREGVRPGLLPQYDRLCRSVGLPVVVPLRAQKCGGCHLKVSSGVDTEVRKGAEIVACDNCARLLYLEV